MKKKQSLFGRILLLSFVLRQVSGRDLAFAYLSFRFSIDQWFSAGRHVAARAFPSSLGHLAESGDIVVVTLMGCYWHLVGRG